MTASRGFPMARNASALCQSGWGSSATRYPSASKVRAMTTPPKEGWST